MRKANVHYANCIFFYINTTYRTKKKPKKRKISVKKKNKEYRPKKQEENPRFFDFLPSNFNFILKKMKLRKHLKVFEIRK